jgi:hypothetical protein
VCRTITRSDTGVLKMPVVTDRPLYVTVVSCDTFTERSFIVWFSPFVGEADAEGSA